MHLRYGYVSNSSSSSFIVAMPHEPTSAKDVHRMMFGRFVRKYKGHTDTAEFTTQHIADQVFKDICVSRITKDRAVNELHTHNYLFPYGCGGGDPYIMNKREAYAITASKDGVSNYEEFHIADLRTVFGKKWKSNPAFIQYANDIRQKLLNELDDKPHQNWDEYQETYYRHNDLVCQQLQVHHPELFDSPYLYLFEYSDNDGAFMSLMEHGEIFHHVPHIRISKH